MAVSSNLVRWLVRAAATGADSVRVDLEDVTIGWVAVADDTDDGADACTRAIEAAQQEAEDHAESVQARARYTFIAAERSTGQEHSERGYLCGPEDKPLSFDKQLMAHLDRCHRLIAEQGDNERQRLAEQNALLLQQHTELLTQQVKLTRLAQELEDNRSLREMVEREAANEERRRDEALDLLKTAAPAFKEYTARMLPPPPNAPAGAIDDVSQIMAALTDEEQAAIVDRMSDEQRQALARVIGHMNRTADEREAQGSNGSS